MSTYGVLQADPVTGLVCSRSLDDKEPFLPRVVRFDLDEWHRYWQGTVPENLDILDVGYWLDDGTYVPPEMDWRRCYVAEFGHPRHQPHEGKEAT